MKYSKIIILSINEAKQILAKFYIDSILKNPEKMTEALLTGKDFIPHNISEWNTNTVVTTFEEENLGEELVLKSKVEIDQVMIDTNSYEYVCVWDKGNVPPEDRILFKKNLNPIDKLNWCRKNDYNRKNKNESND